MADTIGERILYEAKVYRNAPWAAADLASLRALAARADAAERLAKAYDAADRSWGKSGTAAGTIAYTKACDERREALAAWRAIEAADSRPVCHWPPQGAEPRVTSCGKRITFNLGAETCPSCGGRVVEGEVIG